jgi:hypothetical protein
VGAWLTYVSLDGTTHAGANADLNDPIATALMQAGYSVADITAVADTDIDDVSATDTPRVVDLAELRTLETVLRSYTGVDTEGLGYSTKLSQFGTRVQAAYDALKARIEQQYGLEAYAAPYAGGLTITDKQTQELDTNRVQPKITKNLHDAPPYQDRPETDDRYWR